MTRNAESEERKARPIQQTEQVSSGAEPDLCKQRVAQAYRVTSESIEPNRRIVLVNSFKY